MDEMLELRLNTDQKRVFVQTQKQTGGDAGKLWSQLAQKGFDRATISKLQLDGKLGYLTGRNAPLIKRVYEKFNVESDVDLVKSGLYQSSEWRKIIGKDKPESISADEYASHLAKHIEKSFPTAVIAERIKRGEVNLGNNTHNQELTRFLYSHESSFNIGMQPVKTWEGFEQLSSEAKTSAKTLERMYQITPSDESMVTLSKAGIHSAMQIAKSTKNEFMSTFGQEFPNTLEAEMTYNKANEVYSAALGIATSWLTTQAMPNVYAITGKQAKEESEIVAPPSLEELLGNMDYCACDHCKSALSPAAYLVELLQFIDLEEIPHTKSNPIDALKTRRPDIENIQLSCENTNIALPYIDLVNEILEYYIVNGNLTDLKGHDVAEGTKQSELLAEPIYVNTAAYDELKKKVFPYNLPFHQPLETLRRLFQVWDVTLENLLAIFSTPLLSRKEALGFNEDEYKTITNINHKKLPEYFGEPENNSIAQLNAAIANGKTFSRRTGIGYEELVVLLETNFINPGYELIPRFQKLHISLGDLNQFYKGAVSNAQLDTMIPADINPNDYDGDIKQWLRDNEQLIMGLITLTEVAPEAAECDFAEVELRFALPDNTNNSLSTTAYNKFHRFLRLLGKTGWSIQTLDKVLKALLPTLSNDITDANIDAVFVKLFNRLANFKKIASLLNYSERKFTDLLMVLDPANDAELRRAQCAKILKLSLPDLSALCTFTGTNPLADDMEADNPSFMKLITLTRQLKAASLKVADLSYILHHNDITGKLTPSEESLLKNIKILRDTLNAVERENSMAPDNADFNFAKSKMLLVYDAVTTNTFFELLLDTKSFSSALVTSEEGLPPKLTYVNPRLGFDPFKKEIAYAGIMSNAAKTNLETAADSLILADMSSITTQPELDVFIADFKTAVGQIFTNGNAELTAFATDFPELKIIYDAVIAEPSPAAQTSKLVELILPGLKLRIKVNGLQQALIGILKSDADTVSVLTGKKEVLKSEADTSKSVLYDFTQLEEKMVFDQNQTCHFYLDVPATDDYLMFISAPENTVVSLTINNTAIISGVTVGGPGEVKNAAPLSLKTGTLHQAELTIGSLPAGKTASLLWRTKGIEKANIPASAIYASHKVDFAKTSLIRLSKAAQLQNLLKLTTPELGYFASVNSETKDFLNNLDTDGSISVADLSALWTKTELLVNFNLIKKENEPEENTWLQVLKNPDVKNVQSKFLLEYFNLWKEADLTSVLGHFGVNRADLSKLSILKKVMDAMNAMSTIHYPATDVLTWITSDPSHELVTGIKATVKQKVTEATWFETMQTVSDPVRNLLRDALVDYILQYHKPSPEITDANKLYEYFLIDVEMDACMKTSRIRQALSTVQLFIQRCLMNLEPLVDPASIRANHWAWMKRYRVWEANRKVFLYPENWLEPELRDEKSSLFKELEGELLQAEITDESAELAFLNYLKKLDDIAKLDIVAMHLEENEKGNQDDDILHVFGRTGGNTRQYYYRRKDAASWSPWEKVSLSVEGDHIFPIVWRKRLFLFWLNIIEKPAEGDSSKLVKNIGDESWGQNALKNVEVNICWGEYYKGKWTSPKSTELNRPMVIKNLFRFNSNLLRIYGRKDIVENPPGKVRERIVFNIKYWGTGGEQGSAVLTFTSKNAPPYLEYSTDTAIINKVINPLYAAYHKPYEGTPDVTETYNTKIIMPGNTFKVNVKQPSGADTSEITESVLTKKSVLTKGFSILPCWHHVENQFEAPVFYNDEQSTFFVKPEEKTFVPLPKYEGYYPTFEFFIKHKDIPELVREPITVGPPPELLDVGSDITNPWKWNNEAIRTNVNFKTMLPTNDTFVFGETVFDTGGRISGSGF